MTCASCVNRVEKAIGKVAGVDGRRVNLATERATVTYDPASDDRRRNRARGRAGRIRRRPIFHPSQWWPLRYRSRRYGPHTNGSAGAIDDCRSY